jgi:DNA polymerase-3 subunit alpha/error-prone DNA polymerase
VRRLHGGAWEPLCPEIGNVLDETFGLMVYQEDVSKVAVALAAFSHGEADGLRKVLSKKDKLLRLHNYKNKFFAGCRRQNIDQIVVEQVWQMMMSFDGYSFCKPHSASYARVSFQAAFLKRHYPAEFMAAVLSNRGGYYSTFAYVSEAKRLGLTILPPDVQVSRLQWAGRIDELRVGFQEIQGLSAECIARILDNRDKKVFRHLGDFMSRVKPADNEARSLIHAGALDSLDPADNRTALLWQLADFQRITVDKRKISLFEMKLPAAPSLSPPDVKSKARSEFAVLGFLCALHPLNFFNCRHDAVKVHELQARINQRVQLVVWLLSGKLVSTRTGEAMEFLTFEDETGQVETTFFPKIYKKYAYLLKSGRAYVLNGIVEEDFGALTCTVDTVWRL